MKDHPEYEKAMDMLYRAKWNIPQANVAMEMLNTESSWQDIMILFKEYCLHQVINTKKYPRTIEEINYAQERS